MHTGPILPSANRNYARAFAGSESRRVRASAAAPPLRPQTLSQPPPPRVEDEKYLITVDIRINHRPEPTIFLFDSLRFAAVAERFASAIAPLILTSQFHSRHSERGLHKAQRLQHSSKIASMPAMQIGGEKSICERANSREPEPLSAWIVHA